MHLRSLRRTRRRTTGSRLSLAAAIATVLALVLAASLATPASADPSDQPGGTTAVLESDALDRLQQRAAEVQAGLQEQQGEVVAAREAMDAAEADVAEAQAVVAEAEEELAGYQDVVASYAAAVYRDGGGITGDDVLVTSEFVLGRGNHGLGLRDIGLGRVHRLPRGHDLGLLLLESGLHLCGTLLQPVEGVALQHRGGAPRLVAGVGGGRRRERHGEDEGQHRGDGRRERQPGRRRPASSAPQSARVHATTSGAGPC